MVNLFVPYPTLTFAALFLAEELGFFRKLNPRVQLQLGGIDRQIDVLLGGEPGIVPLMHVGLRAWGRGGRPRIVCSVFNQVVHRVVAKPEVRSLGDLRGRLVMVNAFQGASDLETRYVLRKAGLRPEEVRFLEAGPDLEMAQLEALRRGEVDAIASSAPFWYVAEQEGFVILGDVGRYYAKWMPSALIVNEGWSASEPQLIAGLRLSLQEAVNFLEKQPEKALAILVSLIPELSEEAGRVLIDRLRGAWDPKIDTDGLTAYVESYCTEFDLPRPRLESLMLP